MDAAQVEPLRQTWVARAWQRAVRVYANRGLRGLASFTASRLLCRVWETVTFEARATDEAAVTLEWPADETLAVYHSGNQSQMPQELKNFIRANEPELLQRVASGDWVYAVAAGGSFVHIGAVLFATRQIRVLGEPHGTPAIGHCYTSPAARGRGIYRRAVRSMVNRLHAAGHPRIVMETHPENYASRRGIQGAGFRLMRRMKLWIIANSLVVASVDEGGRRRLATWWI